MATICSAMLTPDVESSFAVGGSGTTVDHVVPRAEGGGDQPSNLVACCASCNARKADKRLGVLETSCTTAMTPRYSALEVERLSFWASCRHVLLRHGRARVQGWWAAMSPWGRLEAPWGRRALRRGRRSGATPGWAQHVLGPQG